MAIKSPLDEELKMMDPLATQFMKSYQVWHHRRLLFSQLTATPLTATTAKPLPDVFELASSELEFIAGVLAIDSKNYHTWSYRQWILAHLDDERLWLGELPYVDEMLEDDVRNNSAWHHRFYITFSRGSRSSGATPQEQGDVLQREIT